MCHLASSLTTMVRLADRPKLKFDIRAYTYLIVIPWLRGILLIYTPKARGLRMYISAKSEAAMLQVIYIYIYISLRAHSPDR